MLPFVILTAIATCVLVVAEAKESAAGKWISKPVASLGFLLTAISAGAMASAYGRAVLVALLFCLLGDLLLVPDSRKAFVAGLASFLVGHLAFVTAFWTRGGDRLWILAALALLVPAALLVIRWLAPHIRGAMRVAVPAYILAIVAMGATAAGTFGANGDWRILAGALLFIVSDLTVARNRFVQRAAINRIAGLPLYYAGQLLLAASVAVSP